MAARVARKRRMSSRMSMVVGWVNGLRLLLAFVVGGVVWGVLRAGRGVGGSASPPAGRG